MMRWLNSGTTSRGAAESALYDGATTDDPLATIDRRNSHVYAVSRKNPLFGDSVQSDYDTSGYQSQRSSERDSSSPPSERQFCSTHAQQLASTCSVGEWRQLQQQQQQPAAAAIAASSTNSLVTGDDVIMSSRDQVAVSLSDTVDTSIVEYTVTPPRPVWPTAAAAKLTSTGTLRNVGTLSRGEQIAQQRPISTGATGVSQKHRNNPDDPSSSYTRSSYNRPTSVNFDLSSTGRMSHYCEPVFTNGQQRSFAPDSIVTESLLDLMAPASGALTGPVTVVPVTSGHTTASAFNNRTPRHYMSTNVIEHFQPDSLVTDSLLLLTQPHNQVQVHPRDGVQQRTEADDGLTTGVTTLTSSVSVDRSNNVTCITVSNNNNNKGSNIKASPNATLLKTARNPTIGKSVRSSIGSEIGSVTSLLSTGSTSGLVRPHASGGNDSVAFATRLWERTGLLTNGRKLLIGEQSSINPTLRSKPYSRMCANSTEVLSTRLSRECVDSAGSSRLDGESRRFSKSMANLPISGGWLERLSVSSEELCPAASANLYRQRRSVCLAPSPPLPSQLATKTSYLNQVLPQVDPDTAHEYHTVSHRSRGGSDSSDSGGERRVTFSADTVDNEHSSGRMRKLYESRQSLHSLPPPLQPDFSECESSSPEFDQAPALPPRSVSRISVNELPLSANTLPDSLTGINGSSCTSTADRWSDSGGQRPASVTSILKGDRAKPSNPNSTISTVATAISYSGSTRDLYAEQKGAFRRSVRLKMMWLFALLLMAVVIFAALASLFEWLISARDQSPTAAIVQYPGDDRSALVLSAASVLQVPDVRP